MGKVDRRLDLWQKGAKAFTHLAQRNDGHPDDNATLPHSGPMKHSLLSVIVVAASIAGEPAPAAPSARPPFVGCKSDGQMGPEPAPTSAADVPRVTAGLAPRLAYYKSAYLGVLAPRSWGCFGLYGSNGAILLVTPTGLGRNPFDTHLTGSAVQLSVSASETSGRFEAAETAARLFPNRTKFVDSVVGEGIEPRSDFPSGPYPTDIIHRRGPDVVEFETPPNREGMGTHSRLVKNSDPISGVASMDKDNNATVLVVRLAPALRDLRGAIINSAKQVTGTDPGL
jgi:hypothetical protein